MKTNQIMVRKMQDFEVLQRTKDGMFNATALLKQWNHTLGMKKEVKDFFDNQGTKDFIQVLEIEENYHGGNSPYHASKANKGLNAGTWMHPILFIKFAMWINPRFEYFVIRFVYDQLIAFRHSAGDSYKGLTSAAQKLEGVDFAKIAKGLNYLVFGKHEPGLRQLATEKQLDELTQLEKQFAFAIDMGYIKTFKGLLNEMNRIYHMKNRNYINHPAA